MENEASHLPDPALSHAEPVLPVSDLQQTIRYWQQTLCFPNQWTWGEPATHGGVSWHSAYVQFFRQDANMISPQYIWVRVKNIDQLAEQHRISGADIVSDLDRKPYGFSEYTVKEINGHFITFASPTTYVRPGGGEFPDYVKIVNRKPTVAEYRSLAISVGWLPSSSDAQVSEQLAGLHAGIVAERSDTGEAIGCALVLSDGYSFYYVKDVMVHPAWQNRQIGTAIMKKLSEWLDVSATDKALVGLFTAEDLAPFYAKAGFSNAFGMIRIIDRGHQPKP